MAQATAYSAVKAALATLLRARVGLASVTVSYGAPEKLPDIKSIAGSWENIHFDGAEGDFSNVVFCDGGLDFDEDYVQTCRLQNLRPESLGTQQACDERVEEMLYEVLDELSGQADWDHADLGLSYLEYLIVTPLTQEWTTGRLGGTTGGHAAGLELGLRVQSRRSFP